MLRAFGRRVGFAALLLMMTSTAAALDLQGDACDVRSLAKLGLCEPTPDEGEDQPTQDDGEPDQKESPPEEEAEEERPDPLAPVRPLPSARDAADETLTAVVALVSDVERQAQELQDEVMALLPEEETEPEPEMAAAAAAVSSSSGISSPMMILGVAAAAGAALWMVSSGGAFAGSTSAAQGIRKVPPALPLFTRFQRDSILHHPNRELLYGIICQSPGVRLQDLCDESGLSRTAVTHHLRLMEQQHLVVSRRVGRSRHFFENGGRFGVAQKEAYAVLQNERSDLIARFVQAHPGAIQKNLCEALDMRPSVVHWHIQRLSEAALVQSERQGRTVAYFPTAELGQISAQSTPST